MFSGINSLLFGKKHHQQHSSSEDVSATSEASETPAGHSPGEDYVFVERLHNNPYPALQPLSNLPYTLAPSLPNYGTPKVQNVEVLQNTPPEKSDMLSGVPFVVSSCIQEADSGNNVNVLVGKSRKQLAHGVVKEANEWDFKLETRVLRDINASFNQ